MAHRACHKVTSRAAFIPRLPTTAASLYSPAELFSILKHGIKMTGMPAWSDHSDDELWATVAFLEKLPGMSEQDYAKLVMASIAHGGHHHSGTGDHNLAQPNPDDTRSRSR